MSNPDSRIGATLQEWQWAAYHAGPDLLPAYLGHPDHPATERLQELAAKAKAKGDVYPWAKTPSRLAGNGVAVGFGKWTSFTATQADVDQWALEPDSNVLVQTRNIRALDIDIPDPAIADALEQMICQALGVTLPCRFRPGTGKRTLLLRLTPNEYISKRVIHTKAGAIEFLANGQQTVLIGRHPSGSRFEHRNLEAGIPVVALDAMVQLWDTFRAAYDQQAQPLLIAGEKQGEYLARHAGQAQADPVLDYLAEEGWINGYETNGTANVRCPNEAEHSEGGGANATSWLPAGLGGKERGAFRCLHAHCMHIKTPMFLDMVGYRDKEIDDNFGGTTLQQHPIAVAQTQTQVALAAAPGGKLHGSAALQLLTKNGEELRPTMMLESGKGGPKKTLGNLVKLLQAGPQFLDVQYDTFKAVAQIRTAGQNEYLPLDDNVVGTVRLAAEAVLGHTYGHDEISRHLSLLADYNKFDSAIAWLDRQQWDGVERIGRFAQDILKAPPSPYATALSMYLFVALAGRVLDPGCKADITPVLLSPKQGTGKSSLVEALPPYYEWFGQVDLTKEDDDIYRALKGKVVLELPELRGLIGRDAQATKALLTQQVDRWVPKYREFEVEVPRRGIFIGSDNRNRFLVDPTGNRRWAPIHVARTAEFIDWPTYIKSRDQYWAEARHICQQFAEPKHAVEHYSTALRKLAGPAIADATILDAWHSAVDQFVRQQMPGTLVSLAAIFGHLFGAGLSAMDYSRVNRLRGIMTVLKAEEVQPDVWRVPQPEFVL